MENKEPELKEEERQKCEIWTRIMGYFRPLSVFNPGKNPNSAKGGISAKKKR